MSDYIVKTFPFDIQGRISLPAGAIVLSKTRRVHSYEAEYPEHWGNYQLIVLVPVSGEVEK